MGWMRQRSAASSGPPPVADRPADHGTDRLADALLALAERSDASGTLTFDVQLVVQVCGHREYRRWRAAWRAAAADQGGFWSTARWPDALGHHQVALLVLPIMAGRVGPAAGDHPRAVLTPRFFWGDDGADLDGRAVAAVASWASMPGPGVSALLAPPVLELIRHGRVASRRLVAPELPWPLPVADGLSAAGAPLRLR